MKRLFLFSLMCLMALTMQAQRCAVLEFTAKSGVNQSDVNGIADIFNSHFNPNGYTKIERTRINRLLEEKNLQQSSITSTDDAVRAGRILNVSRVVIGTVTKVMGEYNLDVSVVVVETGEILAGDGQSFSGSSYRANVKLLAERLAQKVNTKEQRLREKEQARIREQGRIAEQERQLKAEQERQFRAEQERKAEQERQANAEKKRKAQLAALGYVDLGLPSGTLWRNNNEPGYSTYESAVSQYGNKLPTSKQFRELIDECQWIWTENGYRINGPNGNYIILHASGWPMDHNLNNRKGTAGRYFTSDNYKLFFLEDGGPEISENRYKLELSSVRLVQLLN